MPRKNLWGGRFGSAQDPFFAEFNDSLSFDKELLEADIEGSLAYARALERAGIFSRNERRSVEKGLQAILDDNRRAPQTVALSHAEDVHSYVEEALKAKVGDLALKLHTGRSRNDQVATDLRLYLRGKENSIREQINLLLESLAGLAEKYPTTIMPGYTHLQRAQPVLFPHYLLAYGEMFLRDRDRLKEAATRANVCPLGSGALSGTVYAIDREELSRDLGFISPSQNSMDAVADRDFVLDFLYFASVLQMHMSRLAEDFILFNSSEFSFVRLDDSIASGSSLMPQKKNPDGLELVRGKTGRVYGHLMSLLTVIKGLPMTYNKDLQEDKEPLFDAVRTIEACLTMTRLVLERITVHTERMIESTAKGYLNATELADYLVSKKMTFREAHSLVGKIVARAAELGAALEEIPLRDYQSFSPLFDGDLFTHLDLKKCVSRRKQLGGTAPETVAKAVRLFRKRIKG